VAALPETFDHVPQILWERSVIPRIKERDATSRNRHDWDGGYGRRDQFRTGASISEHFPVVKGIVQKMHKFWIILQKSSACKVANSQKSAKWAEFANQIASGRREAGGGRWEVGGGKRREWRREAPGGKRSTGQAVESPSRDRDECVTKSPR